MCCAVAAASPACVKLPRRAANVGTLITHDPQAPADTPAISINHASREELEKLPGIGPALAARIVEQRERYGPFRRVEHLMMVRGISERRLRELRRFVTVE
jgi:competence ComEA-like helix-hairpin-helix protein